MAKKKQEGESSYGAAAWTFLEAAKQYGFRLVRRRQQYFVFDGGCYRAISEELVQAATFRFLLRFTDERAEPKFVEETVKTIAYEVQIDDDTPLPSMVTVHAPGSSEGAG